MDTDVVTPGGISIPASALTWRFSHGTGPGGQGVNTTDSRVEMWVDVTALNAGDGVIDRVRAVLGDRLRIVVTSERSQLRNREEAVRRLVDRLDAAAVPERPRTATRPTRSSVRARLDSKRQQSQRKSDRRGPGEDVE
ncbi:MAG: protein chain release factor [Chloroflexi bacterium]|jgi:ribosome-associated protein|nr:protein chain release factor [Chloroflexota bacterium]